MIRSCRIPPVLNRICDDEEDDAATNNDGRRSCGGAIRSAMLVTSDGELLGTSTKNKNAPPKNPESFGTLVADIAFDYLRLGEEYAAIDDGVAEHRTARSQLNFLMLELDEGTVGVTVCVGTDCFAICVATPNASPGLVKERLQALGVYVGEALSTLADGS